MAESSLTVTYTDSLLDGSNGSLESWLLPLLPDAVLVAVQSGFFTAPGWSMLSHQLTGVLERGGEVHLVFGGRPDQAQPFALSEARRLLQEHPDQGSLFVVNHEAAMHTSKTYYVRSSTGAAHAWVGSANLTAGGMRINYQAGVRLHRPGPSTGGETDLCERVLAGIRSWSKPGSPARRIDGATVVAKELIVGPIGETLESMLDLLEEAGTSSGQPTGVPTGLDDIDALTSGLQPGQFVVIGGVSGVGKSVLTLNLCRAVGIVNSLPVALFNLQSPSNEINQRLVAAHARVPVQHMRLGTMTEDDWSRVAKTMQAVASAPIYLATPATLTLEDLKEHVHGIYQEHDLRLLIVDPLTSIKVGGFGPEHREQEVATVSRALKAIAMELRIPVVATCPLGRGPNQRADRRPILEDLRDSGQTAYEADLVILLHREDLYERESSRPGEIDLIVAKHRQGPTVTVTAAFQGHYARILDLAM